MAGTKKASPSSQKDSKILNEQEATKIIQHAKVITVHDLARQTGVKVSAANVFLRESLKKGIIEKVGGFSGHYIYQPKSS
jgi:small subunit ribosomal protein S25e